MPRLTIDQREVEVPPGATVLDAAHSLGIDIPALCFRDGCTPSTSCLACLVRIGGDDRLVPSCATVAAEGMQVESETESVHQTRRTALELLLSDHLGDCVAPCQFGCPAEMDIPTMLRQIAAGQFREAIATMKRDIALPAVLGRICPAPCEKVCRRGDDDAAVSICLLKRLVADIDLASDEPYLPTCKPSTSKRVAIVGAGPTGLSAAYYLCQSGHACTLFDENPQPGGRLLIDCQGTNAGTTPRDCGRGGKPGSPRSTRPQSRGVSACDIKVLNSQTTDEELPRDVLEAEIATIMRLGVDWKPDRRIGPATELTELRERFDAVLLSCGATAHEQAAGWGLSVTQRGIQVKPRTFETGVAAVFAAGNAIRGKSLAIRSVADGKEAAAAIDQFLCGLPVTGAVETFSTKIGRMQGEELARFAAGASSAPRREPVAGISAGFTAQEGAEQATRCLHCDCRGLRSCKLRKYAALYHAQPRRYKAQRRTFQQDAQHAEVLYEPGKCIDCGLCIQIANAAGEPLGLTFVGRGFDVRVAVPLDRPLSEALTKVAAECVAACPTTALAWKRD